MKKIGTALLKILKVIIGLFFIMFVFGAIFVNGVPGKVLFILLGILFGYGFFIFSKYAREEKETNNIMPTGSGAFPDYERYNDSASTQLYSPETSYDNYNRATLDMGKVSRDISKRETEIIKLDNEIEKKRKLLVEINEDIFVQDYGLYKPTYKFANSDLYKERLKDVRSKQKGMIKEGKACTGNMNWSVNGSKAQGNKMVKDMQKLLLRAFNVECDDIVDNVTVSNFQKAKDRIKSSCDQISKLGAIMSISITTGYVNLKVEELCLALDFAQKKQEEKDRIREERERQREEAKAQKEIAETRKKLEKEQAHYMNALSAINEQIAKNPDDPDLLSKKKELEHNINDTNKAIADVDYREANKRAGYVYVISNIGAFGENVYKIGMTRRLDPMDRVNELGDASVPFNFDVHALIFTEDAPGLEAALHNAFESKKVNKINPRREFFKVSLDEIKQVVRNNYDKTVEWIDAPEAEQYRQSILL